MRLYVPSLPPRSRGALVARLRARVALTYVL